VADVVDQARKAIETRLHELEDEARRLRDALASLGGHRPSTARRRTRRRSTTRRAPRGQRQQQFLDAVKKNPGVPVSEIAKEIGVSPQQLYPVAHRLRERGEIRKRGKGYTVKGEDRSRS
jgi:predicted Rossmann fold nucleotide-binding protein DprA/Smf involved in DNA uptake